MAVLTCDFFSESLELGTSMSVVLPQPVESQVGVVAAAATGPPPVLYLLHGLSDDHTAWRRYTAIERYAEAVGVAVVMPAVARSFYADEVHGHAYWTFLADELPEIVASFFRVSDGPAYVAGLSMGGYGALKLALTHPDRYAGAASLSGALDVVGLVREGSRASLFDRVFDGTPAPSDDLFALLDTAPTVPPLHLSCGLDDELLPQTRAFAAAAVAAGSSVTEDYRPGGHEWSLWDRVVEDVLAWLPPAGPQ